MKVYNCCNLEDIEIGDEIYFDDVYTGKLLTQSNFDEYWKVHGKNGSMILVHYKDYYWSVDIKYVRSHISIPK